ncbi:hypothetical protein QQ045_015325 [Rhodiola kirilowii]
MTRLSSAFGLAEHGDELLKGSASKSPDGEINTPERERNTIRRNNQQTSGVGVLQSLREELFSIFIDNIPVNRDERWIRALFSKDGKAQDVFIPARGRRATNSRFGFVRYKTLREALASVRRWNGAHVGMAKLVVSLADNGGKPRSRVRNARRKAPHLDRVGSKDVANSFWRSKSIGGKQGFEAPKAVNDSGGGQHSQHSKRRIVKMESFPEQEDWARTSLVADLKTLKLGETIEKELREEGIDFIKVIPMEGRKILIQFACVEDLERCLTEDFRTVLRNFSCLQRWNEGMLSKTRSAWINILGLPYKAWTESNGELLAAPHGKFLKLDDRDVRFVGAGRARMLIETPKIGRICEMVDAEISGKVFKISLCEDCCLGGCGIDSPDSLSQSEGGSGVPGVGVSPSINIHSGKGSGVLGPGVGRARVVAESAVGGGGAFTGGEAVAAVAAGSLSEPGGAGRGLGNSKFELMDRASDTSDSISSATMESIQRAQVSETIFEEVEGDTSWASLVRKGRKEGSCSWSEKRQTMNACQKKTKKAALCLTSGKVREPAGQSLKTAGSSEKHISSDEENILRLSEKSISITKMEKRKEAKMKKVVKYQRRKKLKSAGLTQNGVDIMGSILNHNVQDMDTIEEERRKEQREEAVESYKQSAGGRNVSIIRRSSTKTTQGEMQLISWNIRGASSKKKQQALRKLKAKGKGFVLVHGKIKVNQQEVEVNFLNVYGPRLEKEKLQFWESLVELKSSNSGVERKSWGVKPFRILNAWLEQPGLNGKVKKAWQSVEAQGWKGYTLQRRLAGVRRMLSQWNKNSFADIRAKLSKSRDEWERLSVLQDSRTLSEEESLRKLALQKIIWLLEIQDERIWRQKSRISWLRLGIFKRSAPCHWFLEELSFGFLSNEQRQFLENNITEEEILSAIKECDGNKAPGPDEFNINFYKKFWLIVGDEVVEFIKEFCRNSRLSKGINKTFIALIPKTVNPQGFADFRPISLVNSMYKILSKCLARRLKQVLPQVVSQNQSAFLSDRNILDGVMIVNELIHAVKKERRTALVIKLDFKKAYDMVSWDYLRSVQLSMGFGSKWIGWMTECYSSASLSILINGSPTKEIPMERGLRQGDPLSPFLFLLAAEGLSRILNSAVQKGKISGVEWVKNGSPLTHLQFADDTVLFCKPDLLEVRKISYILNTFALCSGLELNLSKCRCIGVGLKEEEVQKFAAVLGCPVGKFPLTYLGMQKFKRKLASWRSANLSMAGRVVLIKAALCNLPLYYASMYKMPISVAQEMEKIQRNFLWGSTESRRKIHYVNWSKVTRPKKFGGLGSQGMVDMNLALLAKWWWKLVIGKGGLWRRMVLEKYNIKRPHATDEVAIPQHKLSKTWKDIIKSVQGNSEIALAFKKGLKLKLGNGSSTSFWHDVWLGDKSIKAQYPKLFLLAINNSASVREMGSWMGGDWIWQLIFRRTLFQWEAENRRELEVCLSHIQLKDQLDDRIVWSYSEDGMFSTNSLMKAAMAIKTTKKQWEQIPFQLWSGLTPPKVEMFIWRVYTGGLPTKLALWKRKVIRREEDLVCVLCNSERESDDHLLLHCPWSWKLWTLSINWWGASWASPGTVKCLLESWIVAGVSKSHKRVWKTLGYAILWSIWEERNNRCFQMKRRTVEEIGELVKKGAPGMVD